MRASEIISIQLGRAPQRTKTKAVLLWSCRMRWWVEWGLEAEADLDESFTLSLGLAVEEVCFWVRACLEVGVWPNTGLMDSYKLTKRRKSGHSRPKQQHSWRPVERVWHVWDPWAAWCGMRIELREGSGDTRSWRGEQMLTGPKMVGFHPKGNGPSGGKWPKQRRGQGRKWLGSLCVSLDPRKREGQVKNGVQVSGLGSWVNGSKSWNVDDGTAKQSWDQSPVSPSDSKVTAACGDGNRTKCK